MKLRAELGVGEPPLPVVAGGYVHVVAQQPVARVGRYLHVGVEPQEVVELVREEVLGQFPPVLGEMASDIDADLDDMARGDEVGRYGRQ